MTLWHGTIKAYADGIRKEGLHPSPERAFHVNVIPPPEGIYVSRDKRVARGFAYYRRGYSKVLPGEHFAMNATAWKNEEGQPPVQGIDLTPVVVRFDVPDSMLLDMQPDEDAPFMDALRCLCTIPAQYVQGVEAV